MDREILEEKVYYYTNVIEDPKKLVEAIENDNKDPWGEWMACSGQEYIYGTDKTIALTPDANEKDKYIYNTLQKAFDDVARDYALAHGITEEPKLFPQYPIKKYQAGTFMGAHFDQQEGDERLKVSFVMYLNDDYEGGEISFTIRDPKGPIQGPTPDSDFANADKSAYNFFVKPKAGSIILSYCVKTYTNAKH